MDIQDLFGEPISIYSEEQAIEDGVLHHIEPEAWPWLLVTDTVYRATEAVAEERGHHQSNGNVHVDPVLYPLVTDAILETQRIMKLRKDCDLIVLEHTAVGTVYVRPNSKGGMTIMKPEDN